MPGPKHTGYPGPVDWNAAEEPPPELEPRIQSETDLTDRNSGKVRFRVYDRICIDDLTLHLIKRELYRISGGADPGDDVNDKFKDFLIREGYLV